MGRITFFCRIFISVYRTTCMSIPIYLFLAYIAQYKQCHKFYLFVYFN